MKKININHKTVGAVTHTHTHGCFFREEIRKEVMS